MSTDFQKGESEKDSLVGENTQLEATTNETAYSNCHKRVSLQPYKPTRLEYACVKCAWYVIAFFFVSTIIGIARPNEPLLNFISLIPEWLLQTIFESLFIAVFIVLINVNKHRWGLKGINRCLLTLVYARAVGVLCVVLVGATDVGPFWTKILLIIQMAALVVTWIANIATAIIVLCKTRDLMFGI